MSSSCLKRRFVVFDSFRHRLWAGPPYGDDIESSSDPQQLLATQVPHGRSCQSALFFDVNTLSRMSGLVGSLGFDFHKDDRPEAWIDSDQIDLATAVGFTLGDDH